MNDRWRVKSMCVERANRENLEACELASPVLHLPVH